MVERNTFWKIVNELGVEIPPIQRDYAQGRNTDQASRVRESFLTSIINALDTVNPLSLDFVYGKIFGLKNQKEYHRNVNALQSLLNSVKDYALTVDLKLSNVSIEEKSSEKSDIVYLIPLDGQQRLTTLFLFHWYIAKRLQNKEALLILNRFKYKTRKSSSAFTKLLSNVDTHVIFKEESEKVGKFLQEGEFYKSIKELEYFSLSWLNDPTVCAMMNMLQAIHYRLQRKSDEELRTYWALLTEKDILNFSFLDLENFNLSDDLYVKMNARGKELSSFENFKAWLFGIIEEENLIAKDIWEEYRLKFDIDWNDIFWNNKSSDVFDIDDVYYRFFKRLLLIDITKFATITNTSFTIKDKITTDVLQSEIEGKNFDFEKYFTDLKQSLSAKGFGETKINALVRNRLSTYFKILDNCCKISCEIDLFKNNDNSDFYKFWFNVESKTSWIELIRNYIALSFIEHNADKINEGTIFKDYLRVLFNLFNNQTFDSAILYKNAFNDITRINQYLKINNCDIYYWLENRDYNKSIVFTEVQIKEELRKWKLIENDTASDDDLWVELITKAENHPCFKGKVGFFLNLANDNKSEFKDYYNKIAPLFNSNILDHDKKLLQRALLTKGNYFEKRNDDTYYLLKNDSTSYRSRRENWLGYFSRDSFQEVVNLIDDPIYDYNYVEDSLIKIIAKYREENSLQNFVSQSIENIEFYKLYIYCYQLFDYGESNLVRMANNIYGYQLNKSNTGGYFTDLILEFIKLFYFRDDPNILIVRTKGWVNSPTIVINELQLRLIPYDNKIKAEDRDNNESLDSFQTIQEAVLYLKSKI